MSSQELSTGDGVIGGLGVGTFILIFLWVATIVASLFFVRTGRSIIAVAICLLVALISVVLLVLPREKPNDVDDIIIYDKIFWPRLALIVGLLISFLVGSAVTVVDSFQLVSAKRV